MANSDAKCTKLVSEGPILISTTKIKGHEIMSHLRDKLVENIEKGYIQNAENTKVLILSGTHGDSLGHSGLTDIELFDEHFYEDDCSWVGLKPIKQKQQDIQNIPDITKMNTLNLKYFPNCFLCDEEISKMKFQVINIAYYHKNEEKLIEDIQTFGPSVLALAWCYSMMSDVSQALRQKGILARMVIEHDLREILKNPSAKLDYQQAEIIEKVVNQKPQNVILSGSSGTGKTILLTQALGIKYSYFKRQNIQIRIIVSSFETRFVQTKKLIEDIKLKYLSYLKLEEGQFVTLKDLCEGAIININ